MTSSLFFFERAFSKEKEKCSKKGHDTDRANDRRRGFSVELLIVVAIILIIAAIAIPNLLRAGIAAIGLRSFESEDAYQRLHHEFIHIVQSLSPGASSRSVPLTWPLATAHPTGRRANYFAVSQGTLSLVIKCVAGFLIANLSLACGVARFNAYLTTAMLGVVGQMDTSPA